MQAKPTSGQKEGATIYIICGVVQQLGYCISDSEKQSEEAIDNNKPYSEHKDSSW